MSNLLLRLLELYYNFFGKFYDVNKFEELELDTDSLYLALAEGNLFDSIRSEKKVKKCQRMIVEIHLERIQNKFFPKNM